MGFDPSQLTDKEIEALETAGLTPDDLEASIKDIENLVDSMATIADDFSASEAGASYVELYEKSDKIYDIQAQYNTPEALRVFGRLTSTLEEQYKSHTDKLFSKIDEAEKNGEELLSTKEEREKITQLQEQLEEKSAAYKVISQQSIQIEINGALDALSENCEEGKPCSPTTEKIQKLKELYEEAEYVRYGSYGTQEAIECYEKFLDAYKGFMSEFEGDEDLYLEVRSTIDKHIGVPTDMIGDRGSDYTKRLAEHIKEPAQKAENLNKADFKSTEDFLRKKIALYQEAKENLKNAGKIEADKDFQNQDVSFVKSMKDSTEKLKDLQEQSPEEENT